MEYAYLKKSFTLQKETSDLIVHIISLAGVFLFLYTASTKLADHSAFQNGLVHLAVIGPYANILSWLIPIAELLIAGLMIVPRTAKIGLWAFIGLMILFTDYIATLMMLGIDMPCSCGGVVQQLSWPQHIVFNLFFIAIGITALRLKKRKTKF